MNELVLRTLESFYIGGETREVETVSHGADTQVTGAMYVQRLCPVARTFSIPVIFIHGGCLSGVTWETTPDGREGWQVLFTRGGFDTYVIDQPWRGRSAPDLTSLNTEIIDREAVPPAHTCGYWQLQSFMRGGARVGSAFLRECAAQLLPDFGIPRALASGVRGLSDPRSLGPLIELIDRLGQVVLLTHSQGGDLGWQAAMTRPDKVAAILAVEPGNIPDGLGHENFPDIPVCVMWGDNLPTAEDGPKMRSLSQHHLAASREIANKRARVVVDLLPEHGIQGNGHNLMMENNSEELAQRAMNWLRSQDLGTS